MSQPEEKWHSHYDDPDDNLVLKSNDHVKFRVSSHRLSKISTVFKDMAGMPGGGPSSDPIDIDYSAQTIEDFLNVTTAMAGTATLTSLDFNRVVDLVKITEQFGCDHWHARAIDSLFTADKAKSVAIFDFAVARADWDLGRRAIENFNNSVPRDGQSRTFCEWLETKPLEWQVALYRAIVEGLNVFGCVRSFDMWSTAARSFQRPVDPQKAKLQSPVAMQPESSRE